MDIHELYSQFCEALKAVEIAPMSLDRAARLLAILYVHGGQNEAFVTHPRLTRDIFTAQDVLNIHGGQVPNPEGMRLMQGYIRELESYVKAKSNTAPLWADEMMRRYNVEMHYD